ncbi:MAG: hypothetical protein KBB83_04690 [Alphaproteobacteria bacterium]|nr:hypothetical protein [Alphaproteobacteria bacterium]
MKENKDRSLEGEIQVVSSEKIIRTMQPSLTDVLSLRVINDNAHAEESSVRNLCFVSILCVVVLMATFYF